MKSMHYRSLIIACLLVLVSCSNNNNNGQQRAWMNDSDNGINNPFICCNDVPEYCLRGHDREHILECSRIMAKYNKGGTIDRGCNCIAETDVVAKRVDTYPTASYVERSNYADYVSAPAPLPKKKAVVAKKVVKPTPVPFVVSEPTPEPVASKPPVPTFSSIVQSPKKVAQVTEEQTERCALPSCPNNLNPNGCVCAACVCPQ